MSKKTTSPSPAPIAGPRAKRRPGLLSLLTPLNIALLTLLLGGFVAIGYTQFAEDKPIPTVPTDPPAPITVPPKPVTTSTPPAPSPSPIADRMSLMPMPTPATTPAWEGVADGSTLAIFQTEPPQRGLAPPSADTRKPVNNLDLFTSKPISFTSPTKEYKGYLVAFCCNQSVGFNGGWDRLSEAEKDTYVRHFILK